MAAPFDIRQSADDDNAAILAMYPLAFPDEDLTGLVSRLLPRTDVLSLVAVADGAVIGHVAFTRGQAGDAPVALLAPLCVTPERQHSGVGKALIEAGAAHLSAEGCTAILVLGDPDYYRRRGFDRPSPITPPCPIPDTWAEAWRMRTLDGGTVPEAGRLKTADLWDDPVLWG